MEARAARFRDQLVNKDDFAPPRPYRPVTQREIDAAMDRAHRERAGRLQDIAGSAANTRVISEDGSLDPNAMHLTLRSADPTDLGLLRETARIGKEEGFEVVVRARNPSDVTRNLTPAELENVTIIPLSSVQDVWAEDHGEVSVDGAVSFPTLADSRDDQGLIERSILDDRRRRLSGQGVDTDFSMHGRVELRRNQQRVAGLGVAGEVAIRENLSYVEGGNMLTGSLPSGEGYGLVGRDSVAVTRAALARDLGRPVSEEEALQAIAKDYGLDRKNLHPVEQPGDFHIDMYLSVVGSGEVIVNDAQEAVRLQEQWMRADHAAARPAPPPAGAGPREQAEHASQLQSWSAAGQALEGEISALRSGAERDAKFEALMVRDLEAAGMKVHRMAGVFKDPGSGGSLQPLMNFMNAEKGTGADGKRFIIALGGDERAERYAQERMQAILGQDAPRMHFLDPRLTVPTLELNGGISCRIKSEGALVPPPRPEEPGEEPPPVVDDCDAFPEGDWLRAAA